MNLIWNLLKKLRPISNSQMEDGLAQAARITTSSIVKHAIDVKRPNHSLILMENLFTYSSWTWKLRRSKLWNLEMELRNQEFPKLVTGAAIDAEMRTIATKLNAKSASLTEISVRKCRRSKL